jgi:nicotinate-nucleotide pyrophosphorylase (carboxylating)
MSETMRSGNDGLARLVRTALDEDVGAGDWTTLWTVEEDTLVRATVVAKERLVLSGLEPALEVFRQVDPQVLSTPQARAGDSLSAGSLILEMEGRARSILTAERTALNFLGRLSGVATLTRRFMDEVAGTRAQVIDTRKTTPGLRLLEKAAVRHGGGANHRTGLFDMVLIKENHIAAAGGITAAVIRVRKENRLHLPVEVEVTCREELEEALALGVSRILLDNMTLDELRDAVSLARTHGGETVELEASGNVRLETVGAIARTGVDFISVGALTHSAPNADVSLRIVSGLGGTAFDLPAGDGA